MTVSGSDIVTKMEALGKAALGYSESADGGVGPQYYDCSGLVQTTLTDLGISGVPRTSEEQWSWVQGAGTSHTGVPSASQLSPGDLVFANFGDEVSPGHVGIYAGNGQVYSAEDPSSGIQLSSLASWGSNVTGWATVPSSSETNTGGSTGDSLTGDLGALGTIATNIGDIGSSFADVAQVFTYLGGSSSQQHWFRIGAFFAGIALLVLALMLITRAKPEPIPVPIPL